jgi:hypothetical protein
MQETDSTLISGNTNGRESPDYAAVEIPSKPPAEYTYHERRAELLRFIRELGHPSRINQVEMADRYEVSQSQISKDLDRIAESVRDHVVDRDHRAFTVDTVVRRSIQGLLDEDEYRKAAKTAMEWDGWLTEFHDLTELAERIEAIEAEQKNQ